MIVRPTAAADLPAIKALLDREIAEGFAHFGTEPVDLEQLRVDLESGRPWRVAEAGGRVVGFASSSPWKTRPAYRWTVEIGVYVLPARQGEGIGGALLDALLPALRDTGFRTALAGIALPNPGSVALFESRGFRYAGVLPRVGFKQGAWRDVGYWSLHWGEGPAA